MIKLFASNAVLTASHFNPSVFSELWLYRNGIVNETELESASHKIFSDGVCQIITEEFSLLVLPNQIQITVSDPISGGQFVSERMVKLVNLIPHTPFAGAGLNFIWNGSADDVGDYSRKLFFNSLSPWAHQFDTPDCRFGGYYSKSVLDCRMILDCKPTIDLRDDPKVEAIHLNFNFHKDVFLASAIEMISAHLANWSKAYEMSHKMATEAFV